MTVGLQKCKYSRVVNCILLLHDESVLGGLLHKHERDAVAASTNVRRLTPCSSRCREMAVHFLSLFIA